MVGKVISRNRQAYKLKNYRMWLVLMLETFYYYKCSLLDFLSQERLVTLSLVITANNFPLEKQVRMCQGISRSLVVP